MKNLKYLVLLLIVISCDDVVEVENISNKTVTILAPTNNTVLSITDINFSWNVVEDAELYRLQIATPTFEEATQIILDTVITATNFTKTLDLGNYEWRIRAENSDYQTSYTTQSFTIE